jgi:hypothetical protein
MLQLLKLKYILNRNPLFVQYLSYHIQLFLVTSLQEMLHLWNDLPNGYGVLYDFWEHKIHYIKMGNLTSEISWINILFQIAGELFFPQENLFWVI